MKANADRRDVAVGKDEFRRDFQKGNLYRRWRDIDGTGDYLSQWAMHRSRVVLDIVDAHGLGRTGRTLDVGIGSGALLKELECRGGRAAGADFSRSILDRCRERLVGTGNSVRDRLVQADVESLPFKNGSFELVTCLGVIEYLADDGTALRELHRVLRTGGFLVLAAASYHRIGSLAGLVCAKFGYPSKKTGGANPGGEGRLESRVRLVKPVDLRGEAVRAGFEVKAFKCFGGKILGRYVPIRLFIPGVIYIGDHCVLFLKKPACAVTPSMA